MPYRHVARTRIRQALPAISTGAPSSRLVRLGGELRRALRDQRSLLADEGVALAAHAHDHLAPLPERIGKRPLVGDGHGPLAGAVANPEVRRRALAGVAGLDLAGELVDLAGVRAREQLARRARLAGRGEAGVDEGSGQQHGDAERHHEADLALAAGIHRHRLWRSRPRDRRLDAPGIRPDVRPLLNTI